MKSGMPGALVWDRSEKKKVLRRGSGTSQKVFILCLGMAATSVLCSFVAAFALVCLLLPAFAAADGTVIGTTCRLVLPVFLPLSLNLCFNARYKHAHYSC